MAKPPKPRWFIDADTLGLAHALVRARNDVTYVGDDGKRHNKRWEMDPCVIQDTATPDHVWIPEVTKHGLIILTRDRHIQTRTAEKDQVLVSRAKMFAITSKETLDIWGMLEVVATQWREMERKAQEPGPFIYSVTRSGVAEVDLTLPASVSARPRE